MHITNHCIRFQLGRSTPWWSNWTTIRAKWGMKTSWMTSGCWMTVLCLAKRQRPTITTTMSCKQGAGRKSKWTQGIDLRLTYVASRWSQFCQRCLMTRGDLNKKVIDSSIRIWPRSLTVWIATKDKGWTHCGRPLFKVGRKKERKVEFLCRRSFKLRDPAQTWRCRKRPDCVLWLWARCRESQRRPDWVWLIVSRVFRTYSEQVFLL